MKIVDYCESNKQMGQVCVSRISMKPCKLQGRTSGSQEGKNVGEGVQGKKCLWVKKSPLKTVALAVKL